MQKNNLVSRKVVIVKCILLFLFSCNAVFAQLPMTDFDVEFTPSVKETKTENRQKLYRSLVNSINKNLSLPLTDSTEENWMDAFYSIELLRYKSPWVENKLHVAFAGIENRSGFFQHALMECIFDIYPGEFEKEARSLFGATTSDKCFAICAEYLLRKNSQDHDVLLAILPGRNSAVINGLWNHVAQPKQAFPPLKDLLHQPFFEKAKVVFSFQRKNRNYPGLAVIRDSAGKFAEDAYGNIFSVPQLARSISNLPGYISNGNTPQGIFRMHGFGMSKSIFIGPTANIQLTMPGETSLQHFFNDSTIIDSVWTNDWYKKLLPNSWNAYIPFYESFFAGMAGRTEIIAHGTTVDPSYYKGTTYYPLTPTLGCLCTKELWSETDGKRLQSDQQKLVNALEKAGGADGYYIVVELDDQQKPVSIEELLPYLKQKK